MVGLCEPCHWLEGTITFVLLRADVHSPPDTVLRIPHAEASYSVRCSLPNWRNTLSCVAAALKGSLGEWPSSPFAEDSSRGGILFRALQFVKLAQNSELRCSYH